MNRHPPQKYHRSDHKITPQNMEIGKMENTISKVVEMNYTIKDRLDFISNLCDATLNKENTNSYRYAVIMENVECIADLLGIVLDDNEE